MTTMTEHFPELNGFQVATFDGATAVSDNVNLKQHLNTPSAEGQTLRGNVERALLL